MKKNQVLLTKYENQTDNTIYFGYKKKDAQTKDIEGVTYIEVTPSLIRPKQLWIRLDSLKEVGTIAFDRP